MNIKINPNKKDLGFAAASKGATLIQQAIKQKGKANIILATGASQFEMLSFLIETSIDWSVVTCPKELS